MKQFAAQKFWTMLDGEFRDFSMLSEASFGEDALDYIAALLKREAGKNAPLNHATADVTAIEATEALASELRGDHAWRARHSWEQVRVGGGMSAVMLIFLVAVIVAVAAVCKFGLKLF